MAYFLIPGVFQEITVNEVILNKKGLYIYAIMT